MTLKKWLYRPETIVFVLLILINIQFKWRREEWRHWVLSTDGRGYYAYLTAGFIYQDFTYESNANAIEKQLDNDEMSHHYILETNDGKHFNKTFPGVAICMAPLFFIAYFLSFLLGFPLNGYSDIFLIAIQFSAIFAAIGGFWFIKKLLILLGSKPNIAIGTAFLGLFGTNIYFYATDLPSMGHIYSFFAISAFLFYTHKAIHERRATSNFIATFFLCLTFLIRPTNVIVILLTPFIAGSKDNLIQWFKSLFTNPKILLKVIGIGILMISLLPILWLIQTGSPILWSYTGEGFYWTHPVPHKVLFSFRNGAFIYSPLAFIGMLGLWYSWKKDKFAASFGVIYFLINLYIISAWWTFYYGGGFGHRAMSEHFVFNILLLGMVLDQIPKIKKILSPVILTPFALLSVFQGYQMNKGILPYDYINFKIYKHLFLEYSNDYIGLYQGTHDIRQFGTVYKVDYKRHDKFHIEETIEFHPNTEFGGELIYEINPDDYNNRIYLEVLYSKKRLTDEYFSGVFLVVEGFDVNMKQVFYRTFSFFDYLYEGQNEFSDISAEIQLNQQGVSVYKFFIWNLNKHHFLVKDLEYRLHFIKSE